MQTMKEKLRQFVGHARDKGMEYPTIRHVLLSVGWKEKDIAEVFCARDLELAIPEPAGVGSARDAFFHLLTFAALYTWATSLILLLMTYIDFAFPDPAWQTSYQALEAALSSIRASLAALIVSFPIFLILWHFLLREVQRHPEKAKGAIRRWLGYLSLFVGVVTLSTDTITFVYYLFEGQLTIRFLLKVSVLFLIAGSLVYYLGFTLRSESETEK
jgi:hypothetical protein